MRRVLTRWGLIQSLTIVAIISVLFALLLQPVKWGSDGDISLPVKVFVFDAVNCRPLANAECLVYRSLPALDASTLDEDCPSNRSLISEWPEECRSVTDATGTCVITHKFDTSASDTNPITHARLGNAWIRVEAMGFGGVAVPVRYEARPTSQLRKEGTILVSIGLIPVK